MQYRSESEWMWIEDVLRNGERIEATAVDVKSLRGRYGRGSSQVAPPIIKLRKVRRANRTL